MRKGIGSAPDISFVVCRAEHVVSPVTPALFVGYARVPIPKTVVVYTLMEPDMVARAKTPSMLDHP